jgi:hypothetical protein
VSVDPSAFRFSGYQAVAFFTNVQFAVNRVLPHLIADLGDTLDGDPIALPIPADAPPEVPRLVLVNKEQSVRFEISLRRADVRWLHQATGHEMPLNDFSGFSQRALNAFHQAAHLRPGRVAFITTRFQPYENPGMVLARHFCRPELLSNDPAKKGPLNRPENFELHSHKKFQMGRFLVNSWMRCKTGMLSVGDRNRSIIFVEQDLNTLAEVLEETEFSDDDLRDFHHLALGELETILRLYFPHAEATRSSR